MKMRLRLLTLFTFLVSCAFLQAQSIRYHLCTAEEGRGYFVTDRFNDQMNQLCLNICLQKENATHAEWTERNLANIRDIRPAAQLLLDSLSQEHSAVLRGLGFSLPIEEAVPFVDLDFKDFGGAGGCTSGAHVYVNMDYLRRLRDRNVYLDELIWHELWHVISRNHPDLRREMYRLIGFTIMDAPIVLPADIREHLVFNPDVEQHDSYGTFTIDGQRTDCMILLYSPTTEYEAGNTVNTYLVGNKAYYLLALDGETHQPLRRPDGSWALHHVSEATDFQQVMSGGNTDYCDDPEECMADNFALAILQDTSAPNQQILEDIRRILREYPTQQTSCCCCKK